METTQSAIAHIGSLSYFGLFILGFLAQAVIPIPEEAVLVILGYVIGMGTLSWYIAIPAVIAGMLISDIIIYALAYSGNKVVHWVYQKIFAKIVPLDDVFIKKHIKKIIVIARFLIQLRFLGPFFAGYTKTPWKTFVAYDFPAAIVYGTFYIGIGIFFRNKLELILSGVGQVKNLILIAIGIILLITITKGLKKVMLNSYNKMFKKEHPKTSATHPGIDESAL